MFARSSIFFLLVSIFHGIILANPKVIVITGVSRGIGNALAKNLLQRGMKVIGISRSDKSAVMDLIDKSNFMYLQLDLTNDDELANLQTCFKTYDIKFDYLVNNAAIMMPPQDMKDMSLQNMEEVIKLNLLVPMKLFRILMPFHNRGGKILNITSRAAVTVVPQVAPYCISKAGLDMFTLILREELRPLDIAVAAVIPGEVDTGMQNILRITQDFYLKEKFEENYTGNKLIKSDICAQFLSWLLCDISNDEFNSNKDPWNIYDRQHHAYWLHGFLPQFPF